MKDRELPVVSAGLTAIVLYVIYVLPPLCRWYEAVTR